MQGSRRSHGGRAFTARGVEVHRLLRVWPVLLPRLPCSMVKNSLIFFQLGRTKMDQSKVFAAVRWGLSDGFGAKLPVNLPVSSDSGGDRFVLDWAHSQPPAHGSLRGEALHTVARRRPLSGLYRHYKRANRAGDWPTWREFGEFSLGVRMVVSVAGTAHRGVPTELHTAAHCCCQLSGNLSFNNSTTPPRSRRRPSRNASTRGGARNANCMTLLM